MLIYFCQSSRHILMKIYLIIKSAPLSFRLLCVGSCGLTIASTNKNQRYTNIKIPVLGFFLGASGLFVGFLVGFFVGASHQDLFLRRPTPCELTNNCLCPSFFGKKCSGLILHHRDIVVAKIATMAMFNIAFGTVPKDSPNWKHHPHTLLNHYPAGALIS